MVMKSSEHNRLSQISEDQDDQDKKVSLNHLEKRKIANSNERRRMQNINAGFESLRTCMSLPDGQKYSKATILQMASQSLSALQTANKELNIQLKQLYLAKVNCSCNAFNAIEKIKTTEKWHENHDEGIGSPRDDDVEDISRFDIVQSKSRSDEKLVLPKKFVVSNFNNKKYLKGFTNITSLKSIISPKNRNPDQQVKKLTTCNSGIIIRRPNLRVPRMVSIQGSQQPLPHVIITGKQPSTSIKSDRNETLASTKTQCITLVTNGVKDKPLHRIPKVIDRVETACRQPLKKRSSDTSISDSNQTSHKYQKMNHEMVDNQSPKTSGLPLKVCDQRTSPATSKQPPTIPNKPSREVATIPNQVQYRTLPNTFLYKTVASQTGKNNEPANQTSAQYKPVSNHSITTNKNLEASSNSLKLTDCRERRDKCESHLRSEITLNQLNSPTYESRDGLSLATSNDMVVFNNNTPSKSTSNQVKSSTLAKQPQQQPLVSKADKRVCNEQDQSMINHVEVVIQPDCADVTPSRSPNFSNNYLETILMAIDRLEKQEVATTDNSASLDQLKPTA